MIDSTNFTSEIEKSCKSYFPNSNFHLENKYNSLYQISGSPMSKAINIHNNDQTEVNVLHWFDSFWLYIRIEIKPNNSTFPNVFISLSVFQGSESDSHKKQLFRAEWDNFDDNTIHPQPHWHILPNYTFENTFSEFLERSNEGLQFSELLTQEKEETLNIGNIHFAMNGDWCYQRKYIHQITSYNDIVLWFHGLLGHIKNQIDSLHYSTIE